MPAGSGMTTTRSRSECGSPNSPDCRSAIHSSANSRTAVSYAEEVESKTTGKTSRLSGTRTKHKKYGAVRCLGDWAMDPNPTEGLDSLVEHQRAELSGEAIVVRHADKFSVEAVARRCSQAGCRRASPANRWREPNRKRLAFHVNRDRPPRGPGAIRGLCFCAVTDFRDSGFF